MLLWSAVLRELNERQAGPTPDLALLMQACDSVLKTQQSRVSIPRRFSIPMRELLMLQPRFNRRSGVKSLSLLQHPRFRAAYDFLLLRAQAGVADPELAKWWTDIQVLPQEERVALVQARPPEPAAEGIACAGPATPPPSTRRSGAQLTMSTLWRPAYVAIGSNLESPRERVLEAMQRLATLSAARYAAAIAACISRVPWALRINRISSMPPSGLLTQQSPQELLAELARHRTQHGPQSSVNAGDLA